MSGRQSSRTRASTRRALFYYCDVPLPCCGCAEGDWYSGGDVWPELGPVVIDPLPGSVLEAPGAVPDSGIVPLVSLPLPDMPVLVPEELEPLSFSPGVVVLGFEFIVPEVDESEPVLDPAPGLAPVPPAEPPPLTPAANAALVPNRTLAAVSAIILFMGNLPFC